MNVKISVIIPVYNAEKYLSQCIESLLNQTLKECEFIFINDGSSDKSKEIIEEYKRRDNRIILKNQENQGVSIARNTGLSIAKGEFVGFVDADDYVELDMFENLYTAAKKENCDIVFSNFHNETVGEKCKTHYPFENETLLDRNYITRNILLYFIKAENFNSVCTKIFKNKLIKEHDLKFPEKVALGEDGMFNIYFFSQAYSAMYLNYSGYCYREAIGSATRSFSNHDYFQRSVDTYLLELPEIFNKHFNQMTIQSLKSIKLINSVMGYIYIAIASRISLKRKHQYIKRIISNKYVQESLPIYSEEFVEELGRYERVFLKLMKIKSSLGLLLITLYSQFRNKNNGGIFE